MIAESEVKVPKPRDTRVPKPKPKPKPKPEEDKGYGGGKDEPTLSRYMREADEWEPGDVRRGRVGEAVGRALETAFERVLATPKARVAWGGPGNWGAVGNWGAPGTIRADTWGYTRDEEGRLRRVTSTSPEQRVQARYEEKKATATRATSGYLRTGEDIRLEKRYSRDPQRLGHEVTLPKSPDVGMDLVEVPWREGLADPKVFVPGEGVLYQEGAGVVPWSETGDMLSNASYVYDYLATVINPDRERMLTTPDWFPVGYGGKGLRRGASGAGGGGGGGYGGGGGGGGYGGGGGVSGPYRWRYGKVLWRI